MPRPRIYLNLAHMSESGFEKQYIEEAFRTNWVVPLGPNVDGFEQDLEDYVNKHAVVLSSCTAALHIALLQLGVRPGDEVLCQSLSFCASANPVAYCGAIPIFIDSEKETWNMSPQLLEVAIQDRIAKTGKKPKAIIAVDLYGMPADWLALESIGEKYGIPIIEDAANAMGSCYDGQRCGTFGTLATFSFNGNKIITTSGGGALLCNDLETKKHAVFLSTQARENAPYYQHESVGFNYRMSNICAGIGRGQMKILEEHIRHHKHIHSLYMDLLKDIDGMHIQDNPNARYDSNFWLTTICLEPTVRVKGQDEPRPTYSDCEPNDNVEALRIWLDKANVEARPLWKPMHKQPVYTKDESSGLRVESLPNGLVCQVSDKSIAYVNGVSEALFKTGMCLPSGPYVTDNDVKYTMNCIKEAMV